LLVRSFRIADGIRILLGEEDQSDSDFLVIFPNDRVQEVKKIFFLLGIILRVIYIAAELPHKFDVVQEAISKPISVLYSAR
jgi:hypothetical protein